MEIIQTIANNNTPIKEDTQNIEDADIIIDENFSYDGFQVVRGEFFSHMYEPSITFNNWKVTLNTACIKKLPFVKNIQFLVSSDTMKLVVRSCSEDEKDSFLWCTEKAGKRKPRPISCPVFFAMLVAFMHWKTDYRYKMLGKIIKTGDEYLIVFDLNSTQEYERIIVDGEKTRISRTPTYPADWKGKFGLPVEEHKKLLQVNTFDGYAVFGIQEEKENKYTAQSQVLSEQNTPLNNGDGNNTEAAPQLGTGGKPFEQTPAEAINTNIQQETQQGYMHQNNPQPYQPPIHNGENNVIPGGAEYDRNQY